MVVIRLLVFAVLVIAVNVGYSAYIDSIFQFQQGLVFPHQWILWGVRLYGYYPWILAYGIGVNGAFLTIIALFLSLFLYQTNSLKRQHGVHGKASFLTVKELKKIPVLSSNKIKSSEAIFLGKTGKNNFLQHSGVEHVFVSAPTRSGKGVSIIVPTLLTWSASCVVIDIKGELWAITSKWRLSGVNNHVVKLNLAVHDPENGAYFNPLCEIRLGTEFETRDVFNLALAINDPKGEGLNTHWNRAGYGFLGGLILHVLYKYKCLKKPTPSLKDVYQYLVSSKKGYDFILNDMMIFEHTDSGVCEYVACEARSMVGKEHRERSGVFSTIDAFLKPFNDIALGEITSRSDFSIHDLMHSKKPISLYIIVPPSDLNRLKPVLRIIVELITARNTEQLKFSSGLPQKSYNHRLLLVLDEFPALGALENFETSLAYLAGYGIRALIITQDKSQLDKVYGQNEVISPNCHIHAVFAPNELKTAKWVSERLGNKTVNLKSNQLSGGRGVALKHKVSTSMNYVGRPLMRPEEVMKIKGLGKNKRGEVVSSGRVLILIAGQNPILGQQELYFQNPELKRRAKFGEATCSSVLVEAS